MLKQYHLHNRQTKRLDQTKRFTLKNLKKYREGYRATQSRERQRQPAADTS